LHVKTSTNLNKTRAKTSKALADILALCLQNGRLVFLLVASGKCLKRLFLLRYAECCSGYA
jgi:hypothetical protein